MQVKVVMLDRRRERDAVKAAGGGHKLAADASLHLPWAGIFEPWRPFIAVAEAAEIGTPRQVARKKKKKWKALQGVQLDLDFSNCYVKPLPSDPARPLFDLFPEAYE